MIAADNFFGGRPGSNFSQLVFLAFVTSAVGCVVQSTHDAARTGAPAADNASARAGSSLAIPAGVKLWTANDNVVPICWATPGYDDAKNMFMWAIEDSWLAAANIGVSWQEGCPDDGAPRVAVIFEDGQGTTHGLDTGLGMDAFAIYIGGSVLDDKFKSTAVHEFGHVLGFSHEQDRPDAEARDCDPNATGEGVLGVGAYDPDSIMNYCYTGLDRGFLSEGDYAGVRALYGKRPGWGNFFADFDGDGRSDAIVVNPEAVYGLRSNGFYAPPDFMQLSGGPIYGSEDTLVGDANGDGKADLFLFNGDSIYVSLSQGNAFAAPYLWMGPSYPATRRYLVADMNGDGYADVVYLYDDAVVVALSNGYGAGEATAWWGAFHGSFRTFAGDVDGDGMADLVAISGSNTAVAFSSGSGFRGVWTGEPCVGFYQNLLADMNGDRRVDVVAVNERGIAVCFSTGEGFDGYWTWKKDAFYSLHRSGINGGTFFPDLNGDGIADAIAVNDDANYGLVGTAAGLVSPFVWSGAFYSSSPAYQR